MLKDYIDKQSEVFLDMYNQENILGSGKVNEKANCYTGKSGRFIKFLI